MQKDQHNIISGGRQIWIKSSGYESKVKEIKKKIYLEYSGAITIEKNLFKRLLIKFRRTLAIQKKIGELKSYKNLRLADPSSWFRL